MKRAIKLNVGGREKTYYWEDDTFDSIYSGKKEDYFGIGDLESNDYAEVSYDEVKDTQISFNNDGNMLFSDDIPADVQETLRKVEEAQTDEEKRNRKVVTKILKELKMKE